MSVWASTLISALSGIGGVATGSVVQARFASAQETRRLRYEPAADMAKRLRGAATSVDYLIRPLVSETATIVEEKAYRDAKHLIDEADALRAGIEFAFAANPAVFEAATEAVESLRRAFEAVRRNAGSSETDERQDLRALRSAYDDAIRRFIATVRSQI